MTDTKAKVVGINGNMVTIEFDGSVSMNEVGYVNVDGKKLRGEVIRIRGNKAQMQIFEMTQGIKAGDKVELIAERRSTPNTVFTKATSESYVSTKR